MQEGTKSNILDILDALAESRNQSPPVDAKVLDGEVVVQIFTRDLIRRYISNLSPIID